MRLSFACLIVMLSLLTGPAFAEGQDVSYRASIEKWRKEVDTGLRKDNGWLTLAGRYVLKPGNSSLGCGEGFEVKFPDELCPESDKALGFVTVDEEGNAKDALRVTLHSTAAQPWLKDGMDFDERVMSTTAGGPRDWVNNGRLALHFINRDGKAVLRLADNESEVRKRFKGRIWFDVKDNYKLKGRYVPSKPGTKIAIVDVLGDVHEEPSPGHIEFSMKGKTYKLDAVADDGDDELFIIMKDGTSGNETYGAARFMVVKGPKDLKKTAPVEIDFNKAYNPPCAFSAFTTCPLPPQQNQLAVRIEAGERYRAAP